MTTIKRDKRFEVVEDLGTLWKAKGAFILHSRRERYTKFSGLSFIAIAQNDESFLQKSLQMEFKIPSSTTQVTAGGLYVLVEMSFGFLATVLNVIVLATIKVARSPSSSRGQSQPNREKINMNETISVPVLVL